MSETETTEATETGAEDTEDQEQPKPTETVEFWKAKAREQEKRAKDNAAAAKRLAEFEEASKSETQKIAERADAEFNRANTAEAELLRYKVATDPKFNIPTNAMKFLTGTTREEIEASAKDVLELLGDAGKPRAPRPDPNQGRQAPEVSTPASELASILRQQLNNT